MSHVQSCVEEIAAELDAQLDDDVHVRALAQLDEREARGETLDVIDATALRQSLLRAIESNALTHAKRKLMELRVLVDGMKAPVRSVKPVAVIAIAKPDVAKETGTTVIAFPRQQTRVLAAERQRVHSHVKTRWSQAARVAAFVLAIIAASALVRHYPSAAQTSAPALQPPIATAEAVCLSGCQSDPEAP